MTWQEQQLPTDHKPVSSGRIGVLLVNLGTPEAPEPGAVKRYLAEFLSDPRVIEIPKLIWQPILRTLILTTRPKQSAHAYSQVWTEGGSPLAAITSAQARGLQERMGAMLAAGCDRILLAPLYPQYCAATTATAVDKAGDWLREQRWQPVIRTLPPYHDDPLHIHALADDLGRQIDALDFAPEVLLLSFHGMPERTLHLGDPYHCQCHKTARLLEARMNRPGLRFVTSFQSRFGRAKWLEPATDIVLAEEAAKGTRRLAIAAPGFSADCLETREELAIRGKEQFEEAGGERFAALDCLNTSDAGMAMLEAMVRRELSGWI